MGNRGCLHDDHRRIVRRQATRRWIICRLEYKGWRAPMWVPRRYTPLFFHDEAVALAAGHRPCALCRHDDFVSFRDRFPGADRADDIDRVLHDERSSGRNPTIADPALLPDGVFVVDGGNAALVWRHQLVPWTTAGYGSPRASTGPVALLTPPSTVAVVAAGYRPQLALATS
jgi:hypothetical protein